MSRDPVAVAIRVAEGVIARDARNCPCRVAPCVFCRSAKAALATLQRLKAEAWRVEIETDPEADGTYIEMWSDE